jgi:nucleoside-diphosphate-sugar epimerase
MDYSLINKIKDKNIDVVIHLASIANDPMAEIDKNLSWETSALNTYRLMEFMKERKIKKILYASSGSVYGIKKEKKVTEESKLEPISLYNKVKMVTERIILSYQKEIAPFIIRPSTVCGFSPRMRLDLTVNILTFSALKNNLINVFGGKQIRPNIHIEDMCRIYEFFLSKNKAYSGIYNAGYENKSIIEIAKTVSKITKTKINIIKDKNDPRSYRLNSDKIQKIGFKYTKNYIDAIYELCEEYKNKKLKDRKNNFSLKWLKKILKK